MHAALRMVLRIAFATIVVIYLISLLAGCGGTDAECAHAFVGPLQPGQPAPVYDPAHPLPGFVEVCR